jgi:hypothetical protein
LSQAADEGVPVWQVGCCCGGDPVGEAVVVSWAGFQEAGEARHQASRVDHLGTSGDQVVAQLPLLLAEVVRAGQDQPGQTPW